MNNVSNAISFKNQQPIEMVKRNNVYNINYKASGNDEYVRQNRAPVQSQLPIYDQRVAQAKAYEEARKKQRKQNMKQNVSWAISIGASLAIILAIGIPAIKGFFKKGGMNDELRSALEREAVALKAKDVSKQEIRHPDCYSKEVHNFMSKLEELLKRKDVELKGGKRVTYVQFEGPGGTGKTDSAHLIGKKVIEMFPGSEYYVPDLSMLTSNSYKGQDVQMLSEYTQSIAQRADLLKQEGQKTGIKKYVIMFLDEYDKIAMQDHSMNKANSNRTTGALKTLINELKDRDNVIIMSATNYPELIEGAIDSRMTKKVLFDYLTPKQICASVAEHYRKHSQAGNNLISAELSDMNNPKLKRVCEIIGKREHQMEYRKLFDNIVPDTLSNSPDMGKLELKHFIEAITETGNRRSLKLTDAEVAELKAIASLPEDCSLEVLNSLIEQLSSTAKDLVPKKKGFWARLFGSKN